MRIEIFNSLWLSAFGWGLSESNGIAEWRRLVDWESAKLGDKYPLRNDKYIRRTLDNFAERFNSAKKEGKSNYRDIIPTVKEFHDLYFALVPQFQREAAIAQGGDKICRHCGGDGHVWGLVEQKGHEAEAPEHVMEIPEARLPEVYYGVQGYDCPVCRAAAYGTNTAYRDRVRRNSLPERIPVGDPNNPHDYPECGARVMLDALKARLAQAGLCRDFAGNGDLARVSFARGNSDAELKAEERRVTDELAATFGPI